ncbi:MAG: DciA family protein [Phycisphaerales bacterium]|nr:DUF721 domain-containing protein [Planctomycetota bacterium]
MNLIEARARLEKLRKYRQRATPDLSIARQVGGVAQTLKREDRALARLVQAWDVAVPTELAEACRPRSVRAGIVEVACSSSAAGYALTRWLAEGGRAALASAGATVLGVHLCGPQAGTKGRQSRRSQ